VLRDVFFILVKYLLRLAIDGIIIRLISNINIMSIRNLFGSSQKEKYKKVLTYVLVFVLGGLVTFAVMAAGNSNLYQGRFGFNKFQRSNTFTPHAVSRVVTQGPERTVVTNVQEVRPTSWTTPAVVNKIRNECLKADQDALNKLASHIAEECESDDVPVNPDYSAVIRFAKSACQGREDTILGSVALGRLAQGVYDACR